MTDLSETEGATDIEDSMWSSGDRTTDVAHYLVPFLSVVMMVFVISARTEGRKHGGILHRSFICIAVGTMAGLFVRYWFFALHGRSIDKWQSEVFSDNPMDKTTHPWIFLTIFPYAFWPSGWFARMDYLAFHWDWALLAFLGPIASTFITTALAQCGQYWWRSLFYSAEELAPYHIEIKELYLASACVSIVDPTPMLFLMGDLVVPPILAITVLWESLFAPDTVTFLVTSATNTDFEQLDIQTMWELVRPSQLLFTHILPSIFAGFGIGLTFCLVLRTRWLRARPHWEAICIGIVPILTHSIATVLGLWGILSDIPCGMAMAIYGRAHLSDEGLELADKLVTQITLLLCTLYYIAIACYFTVATAGDGLVLGIWIFFCSVVGRAATIALCIPLIEGLRALRATPPRGDGDGEGHGPEPEGRISRWKLGALLFWGQTRGGVWFGLYFTQKISPNKTLIIDSVVVVWYLSQLLFGSTSRIFYRRLGLPSGVDPIMFEGDGEPYREGWYHNEIVLRPFIALHQWVLKPLFLGEASDQLDDMSDEDRQGGTGDDEAVNAARARAERASEMGTRWMSSASVLPRPSRASRASLPPEFRSQSRPSRASRASPPEFRSESQCRVEMSTLPEDRSWHE